MSKIEPVSTPNQMIDEGTIDLSEVVGMLFENRWLIGGITLAFFLVALFYSIFATPIYRADALLQVEEKSSGLKGMDDLEAMMGGESSSTVTEIEIIKSRKVIGDMVDNLNLTVDVKPHYFPFFGERSAKQYMDLEPASPWLWFDSYAWGGEVIKLDRFTLPDSLIGKTFTLEKRPDDAYALLLNDELVLQGKVGRAATNKKGTIQLFISQFIAREHTRFKINKTSRSTLVAGFQKKIKVSEKGRKTGIMQISYEGSDRAVIASVLTEITRSYLKQNIRRHSEESESMLTFISGQLPELNSELTIAESRLNKHRESKGTIDISFESQSMIERITGVEKAITELDIEKAELSNKITPQHPVIQGINQKLDKLKETRQALEVKVAKLPETELKSVKLSRDVMVANELYMLLLNKSQELKVAKAGTIGSVRVIDVPLASEKQVKPKKVLIVVVSLMLGFIVAIIIVALKNALNKTIHDPKVIENMGLPVYAELPFSDEQQMMDKKNKTRKTKKFELLARTETDHQVLESLRSLRTSIQFAMMEANNNIIMISGPSPEVGKSFVSANFAFLISETHKKVLLVDADMRKGHLSAYFDIKKAPGLSELISGEKTFEDVVHQHVYDNESLDVITCGIYPPNPSELLMSDAFEQFIKSAQQNYDLIIIDTPPILAVTDAAIVARYASANFIILRSGYHPVREVEIAIKRFEQNGISIKGAIFNGVSLRKHGYGYKYASYQYSYK